MTPHFAANYASDVRLGRMKLSSESVLGHIASCIQFTNLADRLRRQFRIAMQLPDGPIVTKAAGAALLEHVSNIVGSCSEKQVTSVDTNRIVAAMEHAQSVLNGAIRQFVRDAMSLFHLLVYSDDAVTTRSIFPPQLCDSSNPRPALIIGTTSDFRPKASDGFWRIHRGNHNAAEGQS